MFTRKQSQGELPTNSVYVIGAAGFWLDRFNDEDTVTRREKLLAQLQLKLARKNLREIRRRTALFTSGVKA